jgi:hypothetical protein
VRDSGSGPFRLLATYSDEESASIHGLGPDGSFLYISSARDSNTERLVALDLKTGKETIIRQMNYLASVTIGTALRTRPSTRNLPRT